MLCAVYRTNKKQQMFLYVPQKGNFEQVPKALMEQFGKPELVMLLPLNKRESLARVDKQKLIEALSDKGYYLQLPPEQENWLDEHRQDLITQGKLEK